MRLLTTANLRDGGELNARRPPGAAWVVTASLLTATAFGVQGSPPVVRTVKTVAGPGFCQASTVIDPTPSQVGALAVDADGRLFTDLPDDPHGRGVVRAVDGTQVSFLRSDKAAGPLTADPLRSLDGLPAASRLAAGTGGAVVIATGPSLVEMSQDPPSSRAIVGIPATQAPPPASSSSGDGGPAAKARFTSARSVVADADHNLYVADQIDAASATFRVRFVNRSDHPVTIYPGTPTQMIVAAGDITTVAGAAGPSSSGDGGDARQAVLQGVPPALAVVGSRLYIASYWAGSPTQGFATVRLVNLGGVPLVANGTTVSPGAIETVAGGPPGSPDADDGPARATALGYIPGIAADDRGGLYLAERQRNRVRFVSNSGTISTYAGGPTGTRLGAGDLDGPATQARLNGVVDVKVGSGPRVFISDQGSGRVLVVDSGGAIHLALGAGRTTHCAPSSSGHQLAPSDERPAEGLPYSVAAGKGGETYFVDLRTRRVMKLDRNGTTSVMAAVSANCPPRGTCTHSGGPDIRWPTAVAVAGDGLYVFDAIGAQVVYLNLGRRPARVNGTVVAPGRVSVVAGMDRGGAWAKLARGDAAGPPGSAPAVLTSTDIPFVLLLEEPIGDIAVDGAGNLFIGDPGNARVLQVNAAGAISVVAGTGAVGSAESCCTKPAGVATDAFGNLYVSDLATRQVWFLNFGHQAIAVHGQTVPTGGAASVAGTGKRGIGGEGPGLKTPLYQPVGLVNDPQGNLFFADYQDHTVRRLDSAGNLSTVAGTGAGGFNGDGLPPYQTALFNPTDVTFDDCGNLLVADLRNDRVRRIDLTAPCPLAATTTSASGPSWLWLWWTAGLTTAALVVGAVLIGWRRRAM